MLNQFLRYAGMLAAMILLNGCTASEFSNKDDPKISSIIIKGTCTDCPASKSFLIRDEYGLTEVMLSEKKFIVHLNSNEPKVIDLLVNMNLYLPIFVMPGDQLSVEFNEMDLINAHSNPSYQGKHAPENELLLDLKNIFKYEIPNNYFFYNCSEKTFLAQLDSLENLGHQHLHKYRESKEKPNEPFVELARHFIDYNIGYYLENYPRVLRNSFAKDTVINSAEYLARKDKIIVENPELLKSSAYLKYLEKKVVDKSLSIFYSAAYDRQGHLFPDLKCRFMAIDSEFQNKKIVSYLRFLHLLSGIQSGDNNTRQFLELFKQSDPDTVYLNKLAEVINKTPSSLVNGMSLPSYRLTDRHDKVRQTDLFSGKVVYMDLWATWCTPCHAERKHFENLIEKFQDQRDDIVFVGVSLDEPQNKEKWKKMLQEKDIKGIQLLAENGFKSKICKDFKISAIPRFIIIDRAGKIIQSNAMRPSDPKIYDHLLGLLHPL